MGFAKFCDRFAASLAAVATPRERYDLVAICMGEYFGVHVDEVSLFSFDKDRMALVFIGDIASKIAGNIPLDAKNCLVSRTAVTRKGSIDNDFSSTPHLHAFEYLISDTSKRIPIRKIMSAPVMNAAGLKGVIEIARKGVTLESAGADFTDKDLEDLAVFATLLADYL